MKYLAGILAFAFTFIVGVVFVRDSPRAPKEVGPTSATQELQIRATAFDQRDHDHTVSGGVLNGRANSLPKPVYPNAAKAVRAAGRVTVQVTIGKDGTVTSAVAVSGHPLLRKPSEVAARKATFAPIRLSDGHPVKVSGVLIYEILPDE